MLFIYAARNVIFNDFNHVVFLCPFFLEVKCPGFMSDIDFSNSGSPREQLFDVVNYQYDERWVKV